MPNSAVSNYFVNLICNRPIFRTGKGHSVLLVHTRLAKLSRGLPDPLAEVVLLEKVNLDVLLVDLFAEHDNLLSSRH